MTEVELLVRLLWAVSTFCGLLALVLAAAQGFTPAEG